MENLQEPWELGFSPLHKEKHKRPLGSAECPRMFLSGSMTNRVDIDRHGTLGASGTEGNRTRRHGLFRRFRPFPGSSSCVHRLHVEGRWASVQVVPGAFTLRRPHVALYICRAAEPEPTAWGGSLEGPRRVPVLSHSPDQSPGETTHLSRLS